MSVLYCRTSVPPCFSITTPFIVLGIDDMALRALKGAGIECPGGDICELKEASRDEAIKGLKEERARSEIVDMDRYKYTASSVTALDRVDATGIHLD